MFHLDVRVCAHKGRETRAHMCRKLGAHINIPYKMSFAHTRHFKFKCVQVKCCTKKVVLTQTFQKLKGTYCLASAGECLRQHNGQKGQVDEVPLKLTTFSYFQRLIQQNYHIRWGNLDTTFFFLEWGHRRQSCGVGGVATPRFLAGKRGAPGRRGS